MSITESSKIKYWETAKKPFKRGSKEFEIRKAKDQGTF